MKRFIRVLGGVGLAAFFRFHTAFDHGHVFFVFKITDAPNHHKSAKADHDRDEYANYSRCHNIRLLFLMLEESEFRLLLIL